MSFPQPIPGQVIRYAYLWQSEHQRGQEEGIKDRPCALVLLTTDEESGQVVTVLPITHTPPYDPATAIELPHPVKVRLGLDDERSWVLLTEANQFAWPGPDLRMKNRGEPNSIVYGELPGKLLLRIKDGFIAAIEARLASVVRRTE